MSTKNPYKLDIWHKLNGQERCWLLLRSLDSGILKSEDVSQLLVKDRINTLATFVLPLTFFPASYYATGSIWPTLFKRKFTRCRNISVNAGIALCGFLAWKYTNPFKKNLTEERERLLGELENRIGPNMMLLNEMLPSYYSEFEVLRRMRVLEQNKNSMWSGIFFENAEKMKPSVDLEVWPRRSMEGLTK